LEEKTTLCASVQTRSIPNESPGVVAVYCCHQSIDNAFWMLDALRDALYKSTTTTTTTQTRHPARPML